MNSKNYLYNKQIQIIFYNIIIKSNLIFYIIFRRILLNLYKHSLSCFFALKDGILKIPGKKQRPIGYNNDNPKVIKVSFNK